MGECKKGRPRDEDVRLRLLEAAARLIEESGSANVSVDAIAAMAGAGKATVYRWWPNKAALLIEAFRRAVQSELSYTSTGSLEQDVVQWLLQFTTMLNGPRGRIFAAFVAGGQSDPEIASAFREFWITPRRAEAKEALRRHCTTGELPEGIDLDLVVEMLYAPLYYRLLTGWGPLTPEYVRGLAHLALQGIAANSYSQKL
jgi:AcrR family transcriptional regulator